MSVKVRDFCYQTQLHNTKLRGCILIAKQALTERESWAFLEQILCLLFSIVHSLYILLVRGQIIPLHIYKPSKTWEGGWDLPLNHNIARLTLSILKMHLLWYLF